jgi:glyoxylase-like metal-dependent hydrolase (beta-lactamase superfamily II)
MGDDEILELHPSPELTVLQAQLGDWDNLNHLLICNSTRDALLIDPFSGEFWSEIIKKRKLKNVTIGLTHSHWDHTKGVSKFLELNPNTEIHVHQFEYTRGWDGPDTHNWTHPPFTFVTLNIGDLKFEIHCTPGHTPGHVTLIGHGVVISGDCLFLGRCGRTDLYGGDMYSMWESQMHLHLRLKQLPSTWIVLPGHQYSIEDGTYPTYISVDYLLKNNPAIAKQSFEEFSKLEFLQFDDSLAEKAKREKARTQ